MTIKQIKELRGLYNEAVNEMRSLNEAAEKDKRGLSTDEQATWDAADKRADELKSRIERLQRTLDRFAELEASDGLNTRGGQGDGEQRGGRGDGHDGGDASGGDPDQAYGAAFKRFLHGGMDWLSADQRQMLLQRRGVLNEADMRDLSVGTQANGGYTVPQGFYNRLTEALKTYGGMLDPNVVEVIPTSTGNTIPMPSEDDTANAATIVGEAVQGNNSVDATFGAVNLLAYTYRTLSKVSLELLQDSAFDIEAYLARKFAMRFGRGMNAHFTTGTNSGQPQGIAGSAGAATGKTGTTGQTTSVTYDDLVDLEHSVDPAYRARARFQFHDSTLKAIKKLKDSQNRPIWMPDYLTSGGGFPATILSYPYTINQDMPVMAANAKSIAFGDFKAYKVRQVMGMLMLRLQERYADYGQVGFIAFMRADGKYISAGNPIRLYVNSAT